MKRTPSLPEPGSYDAGLLAQLQAGPVACGRPPRRGFVRTDPICDAVARLRRRGHKIRTVPTGDGVRYVLSHRKELTS